MPGSSTLGKLHLLPTIIRFSQQEPINQILDIGPGLGTYVDLLRPYLPAVHVTAIEAWAPYIKKFSLEAKYDRVIAADARYFNYASLGQIDCAIAGDVLQHMSFGEARALLNNLLDVSRVVALSVPLGHAPQGEEEGNPFEVHVEADYTLDMVRQFPNVVVAAQDGWIGIAFLCRDERARPLLAQAFEWASATAPRVIAAFGPPDDWDYGALAERLRECLEGGTQVFDQASGSQPANLEPAPSDPISAPHVNPLEKLRGKYGPTGPANHLERFNQLYPFAGKTVFELGGHNVLRELALGEFKAKRWIACDFIRGASGVGTSDRAFEETPELWEELVVPVERAHLIEQREHIDYAVIDGDFSLLQGFSNAFDVSISVNVFEHIADLPRALSVLSRILVPGGTHLAVWAPIWSGQSGHHINAIHDSDHECWYDMGGIVPFDPWDHLLLSPSQMYEKLLSRCSKEAACEIVSQIYTSERINRYSFDDFLRFFDLSEFEIEVIEKSWVVPPPDQILSALWARYPDQNDFSTNAMFMVLRKPG